MTKSITIYSDYKSPYAYLAVASADALAQKYGVNILWRPYVLDIPSYLGDAQIADTGEIITEQRNPHQWRRVRYSYMDVRRYARRQGLTIRGPRKIFDSSIAAVGMLFAQFEDVFRPYHDLVFERFFKRELDIEDPAVIAAVLDEAGADVTGFNEYLKEGGPAEVSRIQTEAEELGIFGVPTFVIDEEIFWGREHLPLIKEMLGRVDT